MLKHVSRTRKRPILKLLSSSKTNSKKQSNLRTAIMKILSALYECGLEDDVDMSVIMQLFGVPMHEIDNTVNMMISFDDVEFLRAYMEHKEQEKEAIINADFNEAMKELDSMSEPEEGFDVEIVDMATGESTHTKMSREELDELDVDNPEELPQKTKRVLH